MKCYTVAVTLLVISLRCSCEKKNLNIPLHLIEEQHAKGNILQNGDQSRSFDMEVKTESKRNVDCGDGQTQCLDGQTCCLSYSGGYGCCPVPDGVCCNNGIHCCPQGYICDYESSGCRKGASLTQFLK